MAIFFLSRPFRSGAKSLGPFPRLIANSVSIAGNAVRFASSTPLWAWAKIPILAEIPDILAIAEAYSEGKLAVEVVPGLRRF